MKQKSITNGKKRCIQCKRVKLLDEFIRSRSCRGGYTLRCKLCMKIRSVRNTIKKQADSIKKCCRCDTEKSLSEFRRDKHSPDGHKDYCILCGKKPFVGASRYKGRLLNTWDQAESVVREIAELQIAIDVEKSKCQERVKIIEDYTSKLIDPEIARMTHLKNMLKDFCKREQINGSALKRDFQFGSIAFHKGILEVSLDTKFTMARMGKP